MDDIDNIINITWAVTAVVFGSFAIVCFVLAYLERPLLQQIGVDRQRQIYVCSALLEGTALTLRTIWCPFKIKQDDSRSVSVSVTAGFLGRGCECAQYGTVLIVCWQWALVSGRMLNWDQKQFARWGYFILALYIAFAGFYLGTCTYAYSQEINENQSKFTKNFLRFDDLAISSKCTVATICWKQAC